MGQLLKVKDFFICNVLKEVILPVQVLTKLASVVILALL